MMNKLAEAQTIELMNNEDAVWFCTQCQHVVEDDDEYRWALCDISGVPGKTHSGCVDHHDDVMDEFVEEAMSLANGGELYDHELEDYEGRQAECDAADAGYFA